MSKYLALCAILAAPVVFAAPKIDKNGVKSPATAANAAIARGSAFVVTGQGLGPAETAPGSVAYGTDLAGVWITFMSADGSATIQAYVREVAPARLVGILPSATPSGAYKVTVTNNGETSDPVDVNVVDRNLGLITRSGLQRGGVTARARVPDADPVAVTFVTPARGGQTIEIDAAGLGPIEAADNDWPPEMNLVEGAVMLVAGQEVPVSYAGRNPSNPGYDRIVVTLPESGLPDGCGILFQIRYGDQATPQAALPVAGQGGACQHPLGISPAGLETIVNGGSIVLGSLTLDQTTLSISVMGFNLDTKTETVSGEFDQVDLRMLELMQDTSDVGAFFVTPNSCRILPDPEPTEEQIATYKPVLLDAGAKLVLTGPAGLNKDVPRDAKENSYQATLSQPGGGIPGLPGIPGIPGMPGGGGSAADAIVRGSYKITGSGGKDIGAFTANLDVVDPIKWTNKDAITVVNRSTDLTATWTGGAAGDSVLLLGMSTGKAPENPEKNVNRIFLCIAPVEAQQIVVPTSILSLMPAAEVALDPSSMGTNVAGLLLEQFNATGKGRFTAPLVAGGNIELGLFQYLFGWMKPASYK